MGKRLFVPVVLLMLLALFHAQLWRGRGSVPNVREMQQRLGEQLASNKLRQAANDQLALEIKDLQEGLEMVEEKARSELGMVKPNEMFVQFTE
ncbi:MAG: septum formation initiator family protein [Burkholderiales bacterium]|nr:septum formation initiator family protein [Burkholderiales bacterium]MBH2018912.1 septum formation initiator family protein [Burkholderiales bacterium]